MKREEAVAVGRSKHEFRAQYTETHGARESEEGRGKQAAEEQQRPPRTAGGARSLLCRLHWSCAVSSCSHALPLLRHRFPASRLFLVLSFHPRIINRASLLLLSGVFSSKDFWMKISHRMFHAMSERVFRYQQKKTNCTTRIETVRRIY